MAQNFLKDSLSNYFVYGTQLLLGFIAIPVYLEAFGEQLYGIYLLSVGLASSFIFLEFGSGKSLLRYTAEFLSDGDERKYAAAIRTCLVITSASCVLIAAIFLGLGYGHPYFFNIDSVYTDEAFGLFSGTALYSFLLIAAQLPQSMLRGAGIFYVRNRLTLIEVALRGLIIFLVWYATLHIYYLLGAELLVVCIGLLFDFVILRKYVPQLLRTERLRRRGGSLIDPKVFHYAKETFFLSLIGFFSQNVDRLLIGLFLDVRFVTIYAIVSKPYGVLKSFLGKFYVVFSPYYVRILKHGGATVLQRFLVKFTQLTNLIVVLGIAVILLLLPQLVRWWLGTDQYNPYLIYGQLLVLTLAIRTLATMLMGALYIVGETRRLVTIELVSVGINLFLSITLVRLIGVGGVMLGTVAQLLVSVPYIQYAATKFFRASGNVDAGTTLLRPLLRRYAANILLLSFIVCLSYIFENGIGLPQPSPGLLVGITLIIAGLLLALNYRRARREAQILRNEFFARYA